MSKSTEVNGVSSDVIQGWKTSLAELAEQASTPKIRDCLRSYNPENPTKENVTSLKSSFSKDIIMDTLSFLSKAPVDPIRLKDEAVKKLCLKIKNYFEDICQICTEPYRIKLDHQPFMNCIVCGQEVHKQCYIEHLRSMNLLNENKELRCPIFNIPGVCYICTSCQMKVANFPNSKTQTSNDHETSPTKQQEEPTAISSVPSSKRTISHDQSPNINKDVSVPSPRRTLPHIPLSPNIVVTNRQDNDIYLGRTEFMRNKFQREIENNIILTSENITEKNLQNKDLSKSSDSSQKNENKELICTFYKKGKCKHGIKGNGCKYKHPKACPKLMKHGNKNPKGCNAGTKCPDFHPRMCSSSIRTNQCFNDNCTFVHVKGTKRKPPQQRNINSSNTPQQLDFQKLLDNFRTEILSLIRDEMKQPPQLPNHQNNQPRFHPPILPQPLMQSKNLNFNQTSHLPNRQYPMIHR